MKPGYQTTEFWTTAATNLMGFLVVIGAVSSGDATSLTQAITTSVTAIATLAANGYVVANYIKSRTELKK